MILQELTLFDNCLFLLLVDNMEFIWPFILFQFMAVLWFFTLRIMVNKRCHVRMLFLSTNLMLFYLTGGQRNLISKYTFKNRFKYSRKLFSLLIFQPDKTFSGWHVEGHHWSAEILKAVLNQLRCWRLHLISWGVEGYPGSAEMLKAVLDQLGWGMMSLIHWDALEYLRSWRLFWINWNVEGLSGQLGCWRIS